MVSKSPVRENRTPGSVRGRRGNPPVYLDEPVSALTREKREEHFRELMKMRTQHIFPAHAEFCPLR